MREEHIITIDGAVGYPGTYKYASGMTIEDLIIQAGGLKESASFVKIDVARRIKQPSSLTSEEFLAVNYTLAIKDGLLVEKDDKFILMPFDQVNVRTSPGYQIQQNVGVNGEVLFEGSYVLSTKTERISDLVRKAGGLTMGAYPEGARLLRQMNSEEREQVKSVLKLSNQGGRDSIDISRIDIGNTYYVGIELDKALENPGSEYDMVLRENDRLEIPQYSGTVKIRGGVLYSNTVSYIKNKKLKYYIEQGGGYGNRAKKRKVFVVHMNGTVTSSRLCSKAKASPGCEIVVPLKAERKGLGRIS